MLQRALRGMVSLRMQRKDEEVVNIYTSEYVPVIGIWPIVLNTRCIIILTELHMGRCLELSLLMVIDY